MAFFWKKKPTQTQYTDSELIKALKEGGPTRERATTYLYKKHFNIVNELIQEYNLSKEACIDLYTETIIIVKNNIIQDNFKEKSRISTYLFSIFRNKCIDLVRKNIRLRQQDTFASSTNIDSFKNSSATPLQRLITKEEVESLKELIAQMGSVCRQLLKLWLYEQADHKYIAKRLGFKNSNTVSSKKHVCYARLKQMVKNKWKYQALYRSSKSKKDQ